MKSNFRVIVSGNSGDGFHYRIEDVHPRPGLDGFTGREIHPFISHGIDGGDLCSAGSIEDLKALLKEMLVACDKKPMYITRPVLREVGT